MKDSLVIGRGHLTIEDVADVAAARRKVLLNDDAGYREMISRGPKLIRRVLREDGFIYGVTTGYGDSCDKEVPEGRYAELPRRLVQFHGCGLGEYFDIPSTRAILLARLTSLAQGYSGVSLELLEGLCSLIAKDIMPLIPQEGSVGASGDLTPLSYVAAALMGERRVMHRGVQKDAADALLQCGLTPYSLRPKEGLAIMNGTAGMTGVACLAFRRASRLARLSTRLTAMVSLALEGNAYHFDSRLFNVKPHAGQAKAAREILADLGGESCGRVKPARIQDPYSIRCAPHVIGVFYDVEPVIRRMIEVELNSANDNPIIDTEHDSIFHGGHFYGGHIAFAMDSLKNLVANIADLLDRQMALVVDEKFNCGLPPNLSGCGGDYALNHGFKAVQIGASAWSAEALKNTMPASVFSRSTEAHNQDKVSMGTIAARDCIRVLELTEQVAAACLIAFTQAIELRKNVDVNDLAVGVLMNQIREISPFLKEDRPLEVDLRQVLAAIREESLEVGA